MRRTILLGALILIGAVGIAASQSEQPKTAKIDKIAENLFVISPGGGNTAAFVTQKGVVLVDTKLPGWGQAIMDAVRSVTDKPVTTIVNTHTHGDHVGSNDFFPASVEIVAQENTKANMQKMPAFQAEKAQFLPDRTYDDRLTLNDGPDRIDLYHFGPGHTNGDTIVVFPALRIAHTGDLFAAAGAPLIDRNNGGSGIAYPETLTKAAAGISGVDRVIPGHSAVTDWQAFVDYGEFNAAFLAAVKQAMAAGKTVDEAAAGLSLPDKFKAYNLGRAAANVKVLYGELESSR